jgi:hypothetical protein
MYGLTNTVPSSSRPLLRIAFGAPLLAVFLFSDWLFIPRDVMGATGSDRRASSITESSREATSSIRVTWWGLVGINMPPSTTTIVLADLNSRIKAQESIRTISDPKTVT